MVVVVNSCITNEIILKENKERGSYEHHTENALKQ